MHAEQQRLCVMSVNERRRLWWWVSPSLNTAPVLLLPLWVVGANWYAGPGVMELDAFSKCVRPRFRKSVSPIITGIRNIQSQYLGDDTNNFLFWLKIRLFGGWAEPSFSFCSSSAKNLLKRARSFCEIMDQTGAGFLKPGQQQRLLFLVQAGQNDYIKEICSPEGLIF